MRVGVLAAAFASLISATAAAVPWPDCYCTDTVGARVELGETACLTIGRRSFMARCAMSLNVPIWRDTGEVCPVS